ncbi:MAG: putative metal-binding motif-containing protein [Bradymonadales bacterium]|jgi:hypothetical protein
MKTSNRVFWALSIGISLFLVSTACIVEDRNIEEDEAFLCSSNDDCLKGSECVKRSDSAPLGKCVKEENVKRCHDYDGDGYFKADKGFEGACGSLPPSMLDCNDDDPNIFPAETEDACDGIDNNCDGCVDGTCPAGKDCYTNQGECIPIIRPCVGVTFEGVCAKAVAGYKLCKGGKFVDGYDDANGVFQDRDCKTADDVKYVVDELEAVGSDKNSQYCDGLDNDCNGIIDDYYEEVGKSPLGCVKCNVVDGENNLCYLTPRTLNFTGSADDADYKRACAAISSAKCACVGTTSCGGTANMDYICTNSKNKQITSHDAMKNEKDVEDWDANCDGEINPLP